MIVEPAAGDRVEDNLNPVGRAYYGFSTLLCTPASLSQDVGLALGTQAGPARIRDVATAAGFTRFRVGGADAVQQRARGSPSDDVGSCQRDARGCDVRAGPDSPTGDGGRRPRRRPRSPAASTADGPDRRWCCCRPGRSSSSRFWKAQVGLPGPALPGGDLRRPGQRPLRPAARRRRVRRRASTPHDTLAVLDATGTDRAVLVGLSCGGDLGGARRRRAPRAGARHRRDRRRLRVPGPAARAGPARLVDAAVRRRTRAGRSTTSTTGSRRLRGLRPVLLRPDVLRAALDQADRGLRSAGRSTSIPQVLADTTAGRLRLRRRDLRVGGAAARRLVRCPVLVIHGTDDRIRAVRDRRAAGRADRRRAACCVEGGGHGLPGARPGAGQPADPGVRRRGVVPAEPAAARRWTRRGGAGGRSARCYLSSPDRPRPRPAGTWRSPPSCGGCAPTCRSTGWPSTR